MKFFVAILSVLSVLSLSLATDYTVCDNLCKKTADGSQCNAIYGLMMSKNAEDKGTSSVQAYVNEQLHSSYDYLLMSTYYNSYVKERPGLSKLFRSLSDETFENAITLIKQLTKRGGVADFAANEETQSDVGITEKVLELDELNALAKALNVEKKLATKAHKIHMDFSNVHKYDPEFGHFMEEKFLTKQADNVRKLTGYVNDLSKILGSENVVDSQARLGVYLFDEYLEKQV